MTLPLSNTAEGGSDNTTVTTGNSGGASGDVWDDVLITAGSTLIFDNERTMHDSLAYKSIAAVANDNSYVVWDTTSIGSEPELYFRGYFNFDAAPTGAVDSWMLYWATTGGTYKAGMQMGAAGGSIPGQLRLMNANANSCADSTGRYDDDTWYRIELHVLQGDGTAGSYEARIYDGDDTSPLETFGDATTDMNAGDFGDLQFGAGNAAGGVFTFWFDDVALAADDWIGPSAAAGPLSLSNTAEGGTHSVAVTTGNSGGASGDAWDIVDFQGTGAFLYDNSRPINTGTLAYYARNQGGGTFNGFAGWDTTTLGTEDECWIRVFVNVETYSTISVTRSIIRMLDASSSPISDIQLTTTGAIRIIEFDSTIIGTSTATLTVDAWYRVEVHWKISTGACELRLYEGQGVTPIETLGPFTGQDFGANPVAQFWIGPNFAGATETWTLYYDDIAFTDVGWLGPTATDVTALENTAEGGSDDVAVTTGNSGGLSGDAWDLISAAGSGELIFDTARTMDSSMAYRATATSESNLIVWCWTSDVSPFSLGLSKGEFWCRWYYNSDNPTGATHPNIWYIEDTNGLSIGKLYVSITGGSVGKLRLLDGDNTLRGETTGSYTNATWYRFEIHVKKGTTTSNGTLELKVFLGHSVTPLETISDTACNMSTFNFARINWVVRGNLEALTTWTDDYAVSSVGWLGPVEEPPATGGVTWIKKGRV